MKQLFLALLFSLLFLFNTSQVTAEEKRIEIDLTKQRLQAYSNEKLVYDFIISSGKPWWPTPTGEFKPWVKIPSQAMRGPGYYLPGVPYVVYFYGAYAIHGTYWHNNFGRPMSHGCVNLRTPDMAQLYPWIDMKTKIRIFGTTPT